METAKNTDLPDLLEHLGYSVRRVGSRYHTTREMDSIRIKDRRTWKRYSNGKGGDAITFLQEFCGKDFREAVNYLLEFNGKRARDSPARQSKPAQTEEKPAFTLPIPHPDQRRVFAYLQKRGIAPQVIRGFIKSGLLYEDSLHHNCVFVGRDGGGKPVFASKRGTYDLSAPVRFCNFSPNGECKKMADKGVQPLNDYTCRFRPSSLKYTDKSGLDGLQTDK